VPDLSEQVVLNLDPQTIQETPMVDLAFLILKKANNPFYYRDIMQEVARLKGLSDKEVADVIAQLYTEINIDGRFACVGQNLWGLKRWYPTDKADDNPTAPRSRLIEDDDDEDQYEDEDDFKDTDDEDYDNDDDKDKDYEEEEEEEEDDDDSDSDDEDSDILDDDEDSDVLVEGDEPLEDSDDADDEDDKY
jgi:DNA-directed RNA polymerase subunit delta